MNDPRLIPILAFVLGGLSLWLMLPRGNARGRWIGMVMAAVAIGLGLSRLPLLGEWVADSLFLILAAVTIVAGVGTITFRNPIYCAIWFGMTLLGVAGLFLFVGAQFLAVATIVVYAGAILVTFLFVLMLAVPQGRAIYDSVSWEASISAATGMMLVGVLSMAVGGVLSPKGDGGQLCTVVSTVEVIQTKNNLRLASEAAMAGNVLAPQHVAKIGDELFRRHLIAVEVTGVLLLAALVGAAVIVGRHRGID